MSQSASGYVQSLIDLLFMAEKSGATAEDIARLERRVNLASKALMPSALICTLNNVRPQPRLGVDGRIPTPQQVHQWIKDVNNGYPRARLALSPEWRLAGD
jgi:hypothetical protein